MAFGYCGYDTLQKRRRPESSRLNEVRAIYWGMLVQLQFYEWCAERGIATTFLNTDANAIIDRALKKAYRGHHWEIVNEIIAYAESHDLMTDSVMHVRKFGRLPSIIRNFAARIDQRFLNRWPGNE